MNRALLLAALLAAAALPALAQAPIATGSAQPAPAASAAAPVESLDTPTPSQAEAAAWARQVLDRAAGKLPPSDDRAELEKTSDERKGCVRNPDRSPHGSAGVAVGSGGYRSADIFVTQPIGDCGQISVGISKSQGGHGRHGRYR